MSEHVQRDGARSPQGGLAEEVRALRSKVAKLERVTTEHRDVSEAYRSLVEDSAQGLAIIQDGRIVFANQKMAFITGYSVSQLKAMSPEEIEALVHPEDRHAVWSRHRDRLDGKALTNPYEFRGIHKDGHVRWLQLYASRITYHGRAAVQGAYVDVTDYKQALQSLEESEQRYRRLFADAPIGIGMATLGGCPIEANKAMQQLLGYTAEELQSLDIVDLYERPEERAAFLAQMQGDGQVRNHPARLRCKDGRFIEVLINSSEVRCKDETLLQTMVTDITRLNQAQQALRESEERFKTLYESVHAGVLVQQVNGQIVHANRIAAEVFGMSTEGIESRTSLDPEWQMVLEDGTPVPGDEHPSMVTLRTGHPVREAVRGLFAGDPSRMRWLLINTEPLRRFPDGTVEQVLITFQDITRLKRAQRELQAAHRFLRTVLDSFPGSVVVLAEDGTIAMFNDAWLAFGQANDLAPEYLREGVNYLDVCRMAEGPWSDEAPQVGAAIEAILRGQRRCFEMEYPCHGPNEERWFSLQAQGFVHDNSRWAILAHIDVTSRVQMERALAFSHTCLEIASVSRDQSSLLGGFVAEIQAFMRCQGVGIRMLDEEDNIPYQAYVGFSQAFYESESPLSLKTDRCMCINVIAGKTDPKLPFYTEHGSFYMNGTSQFLATVSEEEKGQTGNACNEAGFESVALVPIRMNRQILGLIHVADRRENMVPQFKVEALEKVGAELGVALKRLEAEQELRTSQRKLTTIFDSVPVMMLVVNRDRRVVNANRAALEATGYSAEQIEGLRGGDAVRCVHALDAPEGCGFGPFCQECTIRRLVVETLEDGISHRNAEARLCVMAGGQTDERIFQTSTARVDTLTERLALVCIEDITDRKRAEEALRRERDRAQGYLDTVESIVVALNEEGRITLINKKACRLFAYSEEELVGQFWFTECLPQPEGIDTVYPRFLELMAGKLEALEYFENPIIDRTGEVRQIAWHNALLHDDEGRIIGTLSSGEDITERKRAEQAMRESEERHRLLFENASLGIGYFDPKGRVIAFNAIAGAWMGADPKRFVGKSLVEMYGQEAGREYQRRIEDAIHSQTAQVYEDRVVLPAGELWLMSTYTRITNATGDIVGVQIISADITDRKQAEMAMQESEDKYHSLFSEMSSGCALHEIICDAEGAPIDYRTLEVNKTFEALLETQSADVVGKRASEILPQEELRRWLDVFAPVALTGESCHYEMHSPTNDKWFDGNAFCPEPGKFAVTFSDVTRRKQAEIDLERHRAELEAIYEHTPALLCVLDEDRRVLYANRAFTDFTGVSESELKAGRACGVFGCVNATSDPRGCGYGRRCQDCSLYQALEDTLRTGISHRDIEYRATLERHGSQREVVMLGATALVRTSDRSNLLLCLQDVTEQEQAQERSKQREAELLHVSRLSTLGEMVSGFSHELNQPLSAVLNYGTACIRLVESDHPDMKRVAADLAKILGQAERARDIMGRIRALAQRHQPDLNSVDLNHAIANVVDLLSWESRRKQIELNLDLDEQLPPIRADVIQIEQVLLNLIRNAIDAMEETDHGQRLLTIRTRVDKSGLICAEVCDGGVGLPKGAGDRIFEAFFTTKPHGLGIGLSISRTIMEMHGGTLEVRENDGRGCTFVVSFPTVPATE